MDRHQITLAKYGLFDAGNNSIRDEGVRVLSQASWRSIEEVGLSKCRQMKPRMS